MMKARRPLLLFLFLLVVVSPSFGQGFQYYVVVGGFAVEENARQFAAHVLEENFPAVYALHGENSLYYVYVRSTNNKGDAYQTLLRVQEEGFKDAWVYRGFLGDTNFDDYTQKDDKKTDAVAAEPTENKKETSSIETPDGNVATEPVVVKEEPAPTASEPVPVVRPAGSRPFVFSLQSDAGTPVKGLVKLLETETALEYTGYAGNEKVYLVKPNNKSGRWILHCYVIGYQLYRRVFNFNEVQKGITDPEQEIVMPIELIRVRRGDYVEMDEVKFQPNSDILAQSSERELTELVTMMQDNSKYKIKLHGHTNGTQEREIVPRPEGQDFFGLRPDYPKKNASAKELSLLRAETVRQYLVSKGIDGERISTRGEGGTQPAFDPRSKLASANDRVEVEILKH